jgi:hypothetical protein
MGETVLAQGTAIALRLGRDPLASEAPCVIPLEELRDFLMGAHLHQAACCPIDLYPKASDNHLEDRWAQWAGAHLRPGQIVVSEASVLRRPPRRGRPYLEASAHRLAGGPPNRDASRLESLRRIPPFGGGKVGSSAEA